MSKKKYTDIYIAEDSNGDIRISSRRDLSLASARWRKTNALVIYGRNTSWNGSCRMSRAARKAFYKAGLLETIGTKVHDNIDKVISAFAKGLMRLEMLQNTKAISPRSTDLCLGQWEDDNGRSNLLVAYRGLFAKVASVRLDYPVYNYSLLLAIYSNGALHKLVPLKNRQYEKQVADIVDALDEVANDKAKRRR